MQIQQVSPIKQVVTVPYVEGGQSEGLNLAQLVACQGGNDVPEHGEAHVQLRRQYDG